MPCFSQINDAILKRAYTEKYWACVDCLWRSMRAIENFGKFSYWYINPPLALLGKNSIQIALKQLTGVGKVLFGISNGLPNPFKRFIENGNNAFLFGKGWNRYEIGFDKFLRDTLVTNGPTHYPRPSIEEAILR